MTTDEERAARLRRLQERRGTPAAATAGAATAAGPEAVSGPTAGALRASSTGKRRRRHAAPAGRVLAVGLSASAFLSGVAVIAAHPKTWTTGDAEAGAGDGIDLAAVAATTTTQPPTTLPPVPPTVVVVQEVHHTVYVDQYGNPVSGSARQSGTGAPAPRSTATGSTTAASTSSGAAPAPAPVPVAAAPSPPPPPPPPPACSGSTC